MISFVVVSYNSADTLKKCLGSLVKQANSETILVDNNSEDDTIEIASNIKGVRIIKSKENLGFNGGNQLGYVNSKGNIIAFINPDASVPNNFSEEMEKAFDSSGADVIGCRILNEDGSIQKTCSEYPSLQSLLYEHSGYHVIFPNSKAYKNYIYSGWDRKSSRYVKAVSGACTFIKRDMLELIGGLDTGYFLFYEEVDLSKRVEKNGGKILFILHPAITHIGSTSTIKVNSDFINNTYLESRNRYIIKYHGRIYFLLFRSLSVLFDVLASIKSKTSKGYHSLKRKIS